MSKKMMFLVGILALALLVSVGFNLVNNFVNVPQTQRVINIMRTEALRGWLEEMRRVDSLLKAAKTNDDIQQTRNYVHGEAEYFADTLIAGSSEPMYVSVASATHWLSDGLLDMYSGNSSGAVYPRNLDQTELSMIANLTDNLDGLLIRSASPPQELLVYMLDYESNMIDMDPAQKLQKVGVNMTSVLEYLNQITQISIHIVTYY